MRVYRKHKVRFFPVFKAGFEKFVFIKKRLVIYMFYNKIFECADIFKLCFECFIIKKLIYLNADFSILITKERCNTALC